jgi:hypothetical protein
VRDAANDDGFGIHPLPVICTDFEFAAPIERRGNVPGRGRAMQLAKKYDDSARKAVISEWDRWASRHLPTGYKASGDDEMNFFGYMQRHCPHLLTDSEGDPWITVHGWLLLERRVRDQVSITARSRSRY